LANWDININFDIMKIVDSFNIQIWLGLREEYSDTRHTIEEVYSECQSVSNRIPNCYTITPTRFIYKDGYEDGVIIGLINYPRFPKEKEALLIDSLGLAEFLRKKFNQIRVSVTTPEKTYCLGLD